MTANSIAYLNMLENQRHNYSQEVLERRRRDIEERVADNNWRKAVMENRLGRANLSETIKANRAREFETNRNNRAVEFETYRSNKARENENYRSNKAREDENYRSNKAREDENYRSNKAREDETYRHNKASEDEIYRSNRAAEDENVRSHKANEYIGRINASAATTNANANAKNALTRETEEARLAGERAWMLDPKVQEGYGRKAYNEGFVTENEALKSSKDNRSYWYRNILLPGLTGGASAVGAIR